jgi:hypothetical protein
MTSNPLLADEIVQTCVNCDNVHFNVRWSQTNFVWMIACESCGFVYSLYADGTIQIFRSIQ